MLTKMKCVNVVKILTCEFAWYEQLTTSVIQVFWESGICAEQVKQEGTDASLLLFVFTILSEVFWCDYLSMFCQL